MRIVIEQHGPACVVTVDGRSAYGHDAESQLSWLAPQLARTLLRRWRERGPGCVRLTYEEFTPEPTATHESAPVSENR